MGIEWSVIVVWLLILASVRTVKKAVVDGWVQITDPQREAPSLAERRTRAELAQRQALTTGAPGVGQALADRLANFIANPPPRPGWVTEFLSYLAVLLADGLANARRKHAAKQRDREARDRGEQPRTGRPGSPYCWRCEVNHVAKPGDMCTTCTPIVRTKCPGCQVYVPMDELEDGPCSVCRVRASAAPADDTDPDAGIRLVIPG